MGLDEANRRAETLLELARSWPKVESDLPRALATVTEAAARVLKVARASIWQIDDQGIRCDDLYEAPAGRHSNGVQLARQAHPRYFTALDEEDLIVADDAIDDPRTSEFAAGYLVPLGIGAMLDAPLRVGGRSVGVLCHEHVGGRRAWTAADLRDAQMLAGLASLALSIAEHAETEVRLARSLSILRATLEASADGLMTIDREGRVTAYNQRFLSIWGIDASLLDGPPLGERLAVLAEKTAVPELYRRRAATVMARPAEEFTDEIVMADGRTLVATARPQWLGKEIIGRVWTYRDVTQQKLAEKALQDAAIRDSLTGVYNRRYSIERLDEEIKRAARYGGPFTVALLDLDYFKTINDSYGHLVGDAVLVAFAKELSSRVRSSDVVGRYGGEEFFVLFLNAEIAQARDVLAELRARKGSSNPDHPPYTFSGGLAEWKKDGETVEALLKAADVRLYEAKRAGRDRVV